MAMPGPSGLNQPPPPMQYPHMPGAPGPSSHIQPHTGAAAAASTSSAGVNVSGAGMPPGAPGYGMHRVPTPYPGQGPPMHPSQHPEITPAAAGGPPQGALQANGHASVSAMPGMPAGQGVGLPDQGMGMTSQGSLPHAPGQLQSQGQGYSHPGMDSRPATSPPPLGTNAGGQQGSPSGHAHQQHAPPQQQSPHPQQQQQQPAGMPPDMSSSAGPGMQYSGAAGMPGSYPGGNMGMGKGMMGGMGYPGMSVPMMPPQGYHPYWMQPHMLDSKHDSMLRPPAA
jgi:hypothetical protein